MQKRKIKNEGNEAYIKKKNGDAIKENKIYVMEVTKEESGT